MIRLKAIGFPEKAVEWGVKWYKDGVPPWSPEYLMQSSLVPIDEVVELQIQGQGRIVATCFDTWRGEVFKIVTPTRYDVEAGRTYICDFISLKVVEQKEDSQRRSFVSGLPQLPRLPDAAPNLRRFLDSLPKLRARR